MNVNEWMNAGSLPPIMAPHGILSQLIEDVIHSFIRVVCVCGMNGFIFQFFFGSCMYVCLFVGRKEGRE